MSTETSSGLAFLPAIQCHLLCMYNACYWTEVAWGTVHALLCPLCSHASAHCLFLFQPANRLISTMGLLITDALHDPSQGKCHDLPVARSRHQASTQEALQQQMCYS